MCAEFDKVTSLLLSITDVSNEFDKIHCENPASDELADIGSLFGEIRLSDDVFMMYELLASVKKRVAGLSDKYDMSVVLAKVDKILITR